MTQYLVEVRVPALGCRFDARLPNDITFGQAAQLLEQGVLGFQEVQGSGRKTAGQHRSGC